MLLSHLNLAQRLRAVQMQEQVEFRVK
jgi:hypothetical protein